MPRALHDPDKRRAAMLSVLVHALALFALIMWFDLPRTQAEEQEAFLVIDLGTPGQADSEVAAAAADDPAPTAPTPQVAADAPGRPTPGTPDPDAATAGDPLPEEGEQAGAPPDVEEADPVAEEPAEEAPAAEETATGPVPVPTPAARVPEAALPETTPEVQATVPEIEEPELEPRPLADALPVPTPAAAAPDRAVTLPTTLPVTAQARTLTAPAAVAEGPVTTALPRPDAVATATDVPARPLAAPVAQASASDAGALERPTARADAPAARPVAATASAGPTALRRLAVPAVRATVATPAPVSDEVGALATPGEVEGPAGGDADRPAQAADAADAEVGAAGATTAADGAEVATGAPQAAPTQLSETIRRPLAVVVDNTDPGHRRLTGLRQASWVAEMPVEWGLTRLVAFFDRNDPGPVGPVRSARPYFVEAAQLSQAVLVHDGGSPEALQHLGRTATPSFNAYQRGDLFSRASDGEAPYNLFSDGGALRQAMARLDVNPERILRGFRPVPPSDEEAQQASQVRIEWSRDYVSGFRYLPSIDRYRWVRQGSDAVHANGDAVEVEAVLLAEIDARPIPLDPEGRLFISVADGGPARLLWRGAVQEGSWSIDGGLRFTTSAGEQVLLDGLRTWAAFVPAGATILLSD